MDVSLSQELPEFRLKGCFCPLRNRRTIRVGTKQCTE